MAESVEPALESFCVIRPNLLRVRARTDPDLPNLVMLFLLKQTQYYQIRQIGVGPHTNLQQIWTNDME